VSVLDTKARYLSSWESGDVVALQGDAYVHLGAEGDIKNAVPPIGPAHP
jgi:hypothetical protein